MGQQMTHGEGRGVRIGILDLKPGQMFGDRIIQLQQPFIAQLHHGQTGKEFGNRSNPIERGRGRYRLGSQVGIAKAATPEQRLIIDNPHGQPRQVALRHLRLHPSREKFQIGGYFLVRKQVIRHSALVSLIVSLLGY